MVTTHKAVPVQPTRITALLEDVLGCKWSWSILRAIHAGTVRPGQIERGIAGLSTKVLNERLRKLVAHGVLRKMEFKEVPPRVEYAFTALGEKFIAVLHQIETLERACDLQDDGTGAADGHDAAPRAQPPRGRAAKRADASDGPSPAERIDGRIAELGDWRGQTLSRMRRLIREAVPDVVEEWKWMGTPVWSRDGIICTGESYKAVVKLTFAKGAALPDPARLFNASLDGNVRRAIDLREGEKLDEAAFRALVRAAAALNASAAGARKPKRAK